VEHTIRNDEDVVTQAITEFVAKRGNGDPRELAKAVVAALAVYRGKPEKTTW
jgi:hypothetical protein